MKHSFRSIKDATLDSILPPKADAARVDLISAGNPDVLREAAGLADYANPRKRKRGGRVKIDGHKPKHRADRPSRRMRKFGDGGSADAESDQPAQASSDDAPSRGFVDALMANPKVRGVVAGLAGIAKATPVVMRDWNAPLGPKPAYRGGGRARR